MTTPPPNAHQGLLDSEEDRHKVDLVESSEGVNIEKGALGRLAATALTFVACVASTYMVPGLEWARPYKSGEDYIPFWNLVGREFLGQGADAAEKQAKDQQLALLAFDNKPKPKPKKAKTKMAAPKAKVNAKPSASAKPVYPAYSAHEDDEQAIEHKLDHPERLASFYKQLTHTELADEFPGFEKSVTRISHWGDSVLGTDGITAAIRYSMQSRFGDAGHGFHALAQYDPSYRHKGIRFKNESPWEKCYIIHRCMKEDGRYGYGGVTVWSSAVAESTFSTATKGGFGETATRFELWYMAKPQGGKFRVRIDKQDTQLVETDAPEVEDKVAVFNMDEGKHRISVRSTGGRRVRAYGVVLEKDGPGVVWDGMALIGAFTKRLTQLDPEHIQEQIRRRGSNLLVFMFGGNDMTREKTFRESMDVYKEEYAKVINQTRGGSKLPCIVMSAIDHGERQGRKIITREIVPRMIQAQKEVAAEHGCSFFNTYEAMGGEGSMGRWSRMEPRLGSGDLAHPTVHGHKVIGALFYRALMHGYANYREELAGKPLPEFTDQKPSR